MKALQTFALSLTLIFALTGCGAKRVKYDTVKVEGDSKLKTKIVWLKNKRDTIDLQAQFKNESDHSITVDTTALHLSFEGQKGVYDSGTDPIRVDKGETITKVMHFAFRPEVKSKGTAEFVIDPIEIGTGKKIKKESLRMKLPVEG